MFYSISEFPFLSPAVERMTQLRDELLTVGRETNLLDGFYNCTADIMERTESRHIQYWSKDNGFHPEQVGYDARNGEWTAIPLYKHGFPIRWYDAPSAFPVAYDLMKAVPQVNFSAFFRLAPGAGTREHVHTNRNLIFHLCLFDLDGESVMHCNGEERILKKAGDYCLFDYSKPHWSHNSSGSDRINFIIDFTPPGWERPGLKFHD